MLLRRLGEVALVITCSKKRSEATAVLGLQGVMVFLNFMFAFKILTSLLEGASILQMHRYNGLAVFCLASSVSHIDYHLQVVE